MDENVCQKDIPDSYVASVKLQNGKEFFCSVGLDQKGVYWIDTGQNGHTIDIYLDRIGNNVMDFDAFDYSIAEKQRYGLGRSSDVKLPEPEYFTAMAYYKGNLYPLKVRLDFSLNPYYVGDEKHYYKNLAHCALAKQCPSTSGSSFIEIFKHNLVCMYWLNRVLFSFENARDYLPTLQEAVSKVW